MAKGIYFGVGGVARKSKKSHFGVGGVARKVKKMYIGVGGVARLCYSADPGYAGQITPLTNAAQGMAIGSTPDYLLIGSGRGPNITSGYVEVYNSGFVKLSPITSPNYQSDFTLAAEAGSNAVFAVGNGFAEAYSNNLVRTDLAKPLHGLQHGTSVSFNNYAVFAGGWWSPNHYDKIEVYNNSLVKITCPPMPYAMASLASCRVGDFALFGGGMTPNGYRQSIVTAINRSLVVSHPSGLSESKDKLGGGYNSVYGFFAGGISSSSTHLDTVDIYNSSLIRSSAPAMTHKQSWNTGGGRVANGNDNVAFGGGNVVGGTALNLYNNSALRTTLPELPTNRYNVGVGHFKGRAIFSGGNQASPFVEGLTDVCTYDI